MDMYLKVIPKTSIDNYISKYYALNTRINSNLPADWHSDCWYSNKRNENIELTHNYFLKSRGIIYTSIPFSKDKVYIATYPRAIVDIIYTYLEKGLNINKFCRNIADEFLTDEEKEEMFYMLLEFNKHINILEYIKNQFPKEYLGEKERVHNV